MVQTQISCFVGAKRKRIYESIYEISYNISLQTIALCTIYDKLTIISELGKMSRILEICKGRA